MTRYPTAIYARLSVENSGKPEEKAVIQQQIQQCTEYIGAHPDLSLKEIFLDNGKTGTTFQREGLQSLLKDVQSKKISCIIVRDFSRFGRNRQECLRYLCEYFPASGIRFISIQDRYDSLTDDTTNLSLFLQNFMNELYSEDISRKVSSSIHMKMIHGTFKRNRLPYGYLWSGDKIIFDDSVCHFVSLMFQWREEGFSYENIAQKLTQLQAPTPEERQNQLGIRHTSYSSQWYGSTVRYILNNPFYQGNTVYGRRKKCLYKGEALHPVPCEKWNISPDTHSSLISTISEKISEKSHRFSHINPLKGILFCGYCGHKMYFRSVSLNENKTIWKHSYFCSHHKHCVRNHMTLDFLQNILFYLVSNHANLRQKDTTTSSTTSLKKENILHYQRYQQGFMSKSHYLSQKKEENFPKLTADFTAFHPDMITHFIDRIYVYQQDKISVHLSYKDFF